MQLVCAVCGVKDKNDRVGHSCTWICPLCKTKQTYICECPQCSSNIEEFCDNLIDFDQDFELEE